MRDEAESTGNEIAVIGMAGRWPGAETLDEFWHNISHGIESVRRFTDAELLAAGESADLLRDPDYVRARPVLDGVDRFDAPFFGFSPQDAAIMDPQHRLFLEVGWESLEHAGHDPARFAGQVGVFATCGMNTYMMYHLVTNPRIMDTVGEWLVRHTGNDMNFLATRLSYQLNLTGPSLNVQSACSSALVAIHLAAQSLLNGECDMALAGGSVIALPQDRGYLYKKGEILSPDGHCRPFDAKAAGTLFGSGAGVVVLRRLQDAVDSGDRIYAVIKGSAVNNDGAMKVGYLAPSVEGQSRAITEALAISGVDATSIGYIEAHGTGTLVGDPIEITALTEAFRQYTDRTGFCAIGSLKSNIGHLGEAAGVAGFIKAVLSLEHRQLPPTIHFETPNPRLELATSPFVVNDRLREWPESGSPRRAGITSLGAGGTNCHVIVQEAPRTDAPAPSRSTQLLVLSTRTPTALDTATARLADHLERHPALSLADVAMTLQRGRKAFAYRRAVAVRGPQEAPAALRATLAAGAPPAPIGDRPPVVAFMFPGQGSQYVGMGRDLYAEEPVFRAAIDECDTVYRAARGTSIVDAMFTAGGAGASTIDDTALAQPALFAVEYALARLWMSWGIEPHAMIGHSIGEYVAACLAGVFTVRDAMVLVTARGSLMQDLPRGAMLSVNVAAAEVGGILPPGVSIAASNAPALCVVSGPTADVDVVEAEAARRGWETRRLHTSHAFHSGMMDPILERFRAVVRQVRLSAPTRPYISNVTGAWIRVEDATDPDYWVRHLRGTVKFADGIATILGESSGVLIEVGPGRTLGMLARQSSAPVVLQSLRHAHEQTPDLTVMTTALGRLWGAGLNPTWDALHSGERRTRVPLPTYPFERQSHWVAAPPAGPAPTPLPAAPTTRRAPDMADWFHVPTWTAAPLDAREVRPPEGDVLVFTHDGDEVSEATRGWQNLPAPDVETRTPRRLEFPTPGDTDVARLMPFELGDLADHEVEIRVTAAALNFADVLKVTGLQPEAPFGMECSGVIVRTGAHVRQFAPGDAVLAIGPDSFQSHVRRDARFVARMPAQLDPFEAVTIPAAYMTALHALEEIGRIQPGERVLIHAASGGVGLAALQVAWARGAEVFATAGNPAKRAFLTSLGLTHVFSSRNLDFADAIRSATGGRGVDVVLNSLTGAFIPASLGLVAPGGRFLEIGKSDVYDAGRLSALGLASGVTYHAIDLTRTLRDDPDHYGALLRECVDRVAAGRWLPLPRHDFGVGEAVEAFRLMSDARHVGKIVLDFRTTGARRFVVERGSGFTSVGPNRFTVNPEDARDYDALFEALRQAHADLRHVVHGWTLMTPPDQSLDRTLDASFFEPLLLAQAIGRQEFSARLNVTFITSQTTSVSGETPIVPARSTVLGPSLVLPREVPHVRTRVVDITQPTSPTQRARRVDALMAELGSDITQPRVAHRGGTRWVQTVARRRLEGTGRHPWRHRGVYLITGGTGGLGLALAQRLAESVRATVVLIGRTRLPPRDQWDAAIESADVDPKVIACIDGIRACERAGGTVLVAHADVADAASMRQIVDEVRSQHGQIHGVFHAAGAIDDGPLELKTREAALGVLRPKLQGTMVLHDLFAGQPLDCFVLFSSVSSALGLQGQVDYTAANAFLDAFASQRDAEASCPVISVGWSAWKDVGLAAHASDDRRPVGAPARHPWLGRYRRGAAGSVVFTLSLSRETTWGIGEHVVRNGDAVLPGTGYLELVHGAIRELQPEGTVDISRVFFENPLVLGSDEVKLVTLTLAPDDGGYHFTIASADGTHASGHVATTVAAHASPLDIDAIRSRCRVREEAPHGFLPQPFMQFGDRWANVTRVNYGDREALVSLALPSAYADDVPAYALHPALLDMATGAAQLLIPGFAPTTDFYVPFSYARLLAFGPLPGRLVSHVRLAEGTANGMAVFDVTIANEQGAVVTQITGFCMRRISGALDRPAAGRAQAPGAVLSPAAALARDMLTDGIAPSDGLLALERVLGAHAGPHVYVSPGDLSAWRARVEAEIRPDAPGLDAQRPSKRSSTEPDSAADPNDIEGRLRSMWSDLLGVTTIGPEDNFFDIGGHSLLAVRLLTRIEKTFGRSIPLATLFGDGTINALASLIRGTGTAPAPDDGSDDEPLLTAVSRDALRMRSSDLDSTS